MDGVVSLRSLRIFAFCGDSFAVFRFILTAMAWRIHDWVRRGEVDNTQRGWVYGRLWLAGRREPLELDLRGDAWRDLAGCQLFFTRLRAVPTQGLAPGRALLAPMQTGVIGDFTASRKVKVPALPAAEFHERLRRHLPFPVRLANCLYLEWFSEANGRVVFESVDFALRISAPEWTMTPLEERRQRQANARELRRFLDRLCGPGEDEETG